MTVGSVGKGSCQYLEFGHKVCMIMIVSYGNNSEQGSNIVDKGLMGATVVTESLEPKLNHELNIKSYQIGSQGRSERAWYLN